MERSGFFNSNVNGDVYDREYDALDFASYFARFIGNGYFAGNSNELQVVELNPQSMGIAIRSGQAYINGFWYENTDDLTKDVGVADGVLNRIDSVVLRYGTAERNTWAVVKRGTPAVNPSAPDVTRNSDYYELKLADILVPAGTVNIRQASIIDRRLDSTVCGIVTGLVEQLDTTHYADQLQAFINDLKISSVEDVGRLLDELNELVNGDPVGNIVLRLDALENTKIVTLPSTGWVGTSAPFTQTVEVPGVTSEHSAICVSNLSETATLSEQKAYMKAYGIVTSGYASFGDGTATFKVYKKPEITLSIGLKGVL